MGAIDYKDLSWALTETGAEDFEPDHANKSLSDNLMALEARLVFDGAAIATFDAAVDDLAEGLDDKSSASEAVHDAEEAAVAATAGLALAEALGTMADDAGQGRLEIAFVDWSVTGADILRDMFGGDAVIVEIEPGRDGVAQMADTMQTYSEVDAVHLITHGASGEIRLGEAVLTEDTLGGQHADDVAAMAASMRQGGDILVYGCNFAGGEHGRSFAEALARDTGQDIGAFDDLACFDAPEGFWGDVANRANAFGYRLA